MDRRTLPGAVGQPPRRTTDGLALRNPNIPAFAESRQSRVFFMGGLRILASRPVTFISALPLVCRGEATSQGLVVELSVRRADYSLLFSPGTSGNGDDLF